MRLSGIGQFTFDKNIEWYYSPAFKIKAFDNKEFKFVIDNYDKKRNEQYINIINNFINISEKLKHNADHEILRYYNDCKEYCENDLEINKPQNVWKYISVTPEIMISYRDEVDPELYISLECNCEWEEEHGL